MKIGVGIFSFNRPGYLEQQLKSIQESPYLDDYEFHLFQDSFKNKFTGQLVANPSQILECIKAFSNADFPYKKIHARKENVSIAINQYEGMKFLCENYEAAMLVEDDVLLSPYWFRLARTLLEQTKNKKNMFAFSPGFKKTGTDHTKLVADNHHHWVDVMWSERWLRIEPLFLQYYELVKDISYTHRDHGKIMRFFEKVGNPQTGVTSQDSAKYWALTKLGMARYRFEVNRAFYIGEKGVHFNPGFYEKNQFGLQRPYIFDEDVHLKEFKIE